MAAVTSPTRQAAAGSRAPSKGPDAPASKPRNTNKPRGNEHEYIYFAAEEILTGITANEAGSGAGLTATSGNEAREELRSAVDAALKKHTITAWLATLKEQVVLHEKRRIRLSDLFVQCSVKFLSHCWANPMFRVHIHTDANLESLAAVTPLFLSWPNDDVQRLFAEVTLHAGLHRFQAVTDFLGEHHDTHPELCCGLLAHAFVDEKAHLRVSQACRFINNFIELLKAASLSRTGLRRLAIGIEHALLANHPKGLSINLMKNEPELLLRMLEALRGYIEAPVVKQSMAVVLAQTMGRHYQPIEDFDKLVLLTLDVAGPLLESEFMVFMPTLHRLAMQGGQRVAMPLLSRQLHMRVSRLLEEAVDTLEMPSASQEQPEGKGPVLGEYQRVQWSLALLTLLAGCEETGKADGASKRASSHDPHFEAFVCVDLLPILVRVLRASPHAYETLAACFLISSVAQSPCLPPYMPDIIRLSEHSVLPRLTLGGGDQPAVKFSRRRESLAEEGSWQPIILPVGERMLLGVNRSFIHTIACAGYLPVDRPALLNSKSVFQFIARLECDADMFADPACPLHVKLYCFAHLCVRKENHAKLLEFGIFQALRNARIQIAEAAEMMMEFAEEPHDLRLHFIHAVASLAAHPPTGARLLHDSANVDLVITALAYAEAVHRERRPMKRLKGLGEAFTCQEALASSLVRLSAREEFSNVHTPFTIFLLGLISSAPLVNLRVAACEHMVELLTKGRSPEVPGAVLLKTPCASSFKRIICGPNDEVISGVAQVMAAFVQKSGYLTHIHLVQIVEAVVAVIANASSSAARVLALAELFLVFSTRSEEVINVFVELEDVVPFLQLAKSTSMYRREVVQQWLEMYGSSMYEISEVMRMFQSSTMDGFLYLAGRCTLARQKAEDFRRCMFAVIHRRVDTWRKTPFGISQFMSEELLKAMIPMCEMQPDLVAGLLAMFHSFITNKETLVLNRLWTGGHFEWLCRRMLHKSCDQIAQEQAKAGVRRTAPIRPTETHWESHVDLIAAQGMVQRLLWALYHNKRLEVPTQAVNNGWIVKNWQEHANYYCHYPWPKREIKEMEEMTDSVFILAMTLAQTLTFDVDRELQLALIKQGILQLCSTILLPNPEAQKQMLEASIHAGHDRSGASSHPEEALDVPQEKMLAGSITVRLLKLQEAYEYYQDPQNKALTIAMLSQLHHWRRAVFEQQGSLSVLVTVGLLERSAALYSALVSGPTLEWFLEHVGLRHMEVLCTLLLDIWCRHPNSVLKHHALRLVSLFCQLNVLYVSVMAFEPKAEMASQAIHRILGIWDVRELRHALRLIIAALVHALGIPAMPESVSVIVARKLTNHDSASLREVLQQGGVLRSNQLGNRYLLLPKYLTSIIEWSEHPGDLYARTWSQWLLLTLLAHSDWGRLQEENVEAGVISFSKQVVEKHLLRRARLEKEQQSVELHKGQEAPLVRDILPSGGKEKMHCFTSWFRDSPRLGAVVARMVSKCTAEEWLPAQLIGCVAGARCLVEHPHFLCNAAEILNGAILVPFLTGADRVLAMASLVLITLLSTYRLPLKAQNCAGSFLTSFYNLQEAVIKGYSRCGGSAYDMSAVWLTELSVDTPLKEDYRCLVSFMIGQCILPPLVVAPTLDFGEGPGSEGPDGPPAVTECERPPYLLMPKLASDILQEDHRMKESQVKDQGPLFSTLSCHLLYALAVMVPLHPKVAAESAKVRGAAFSQLFKIQQIVARSMKPQDLYEPADKDRGKLFLYIRALACIRLALRVITGTWFAANIGVKFVISEQGGRDFMQYCTRHIIQVYNSKTAVTRVLGTPWERMMLSQGPTETIADLLLMVCSSDSNLLELERLGGEKALHGLSQYSPTLAIRQQATMLLSKLAVMTQT